MTSYNSIRVVAADDHQLELLGIASVLHAEDDIDLIAQTTRGIEALRLIKSLSPDVVVLSLHMADMTGFEVIKAMQGLNVSCAVVLLASTVTHEEFTEAMRLNVQGILLKKMAPSLLTMCVRTVHAGEVFFEKDMLRIELGRLLQETGANTSLTSILTARELTVVQLAVSGLSNKHLARELGISEGTVKLHLHRAYEKLRVHGRVGLIQMMHKHGLG